MMDPGLPSNFGLVDQGSGTCSLVQSQYCSDSWVFQKLLTCVIQKMILVQRSIDYCEMDGMVVGMLCEKTLYHIKRDQDACRIGIVLKKKMSCNIPRGAYIL